jgi:hypothetical protein
MKSFTNKILLFVFFILLMSGMTLLLKKTLISNELAGGGIWDTVKFNTTYSDEVMSANDSISQVKEEWVARYNGPGNGDDEAISLAVDSSGNVYVTGYSGDGKGITWSYATIKYNSLGIRQWVARYNGPANGMDGPSSLVIDGSGNVYVTGISWGKGTQTDYATIKYNSSGVQQWVTRYNAQDHRDEATSIAIDGSGNVYVTGKSYDTRSDFDYATVKYNSSGIQQWVARYNGPNGDDFANSLAVDQSGNVYVTGSSQGGGDDFDYATIKYNSSGVQQWIARYNEPGNGIEATSISIDGSGNVYVTGSKIIESNYYYTIKYNSSGVQQWVSKYNGIHQPSLVIDDSGNVYVRGNISNGTDCDYATIKYNPSGVQQWVSRYNSGHGYSTALAIDDSGNVYITGKTEGETGVGFATIKYDASGVQQWVQRYISPANGKDNQPSSIAIDRSGNVYVTGTSMGKGTDYDYVTIKYSQR